MHGVRSGMLDKPFPRPDIVDSLLGVGVEEKS